MEEIYSTEIKGLTQLNMQRKQELIISGFVFLPIKNIDYVEEDATVYNFEVENEHTYVANCIAVHNCFVLPIEDSLESIFKTLEDMAIIQQSGGGTGFSFSRLRPKGDIVKSTKGIASGPVSFMKVYDQTTDTIKQGGKRRGANMGILNVSHPDIVEFITSKSGKKLSNFNISVAATDDFLKKALKNKKFSLINPKNHQVTGKVSAKQIFDLIVQNAHSSGDPGMIFIDEINRKHPLKNIGMIESTNPCGEVPLLPYESCNLGSINLTKIVKDNKIDWSKLKELTHLSVNFLDNVIDKNSYPLPEIEKITKANRKIGLGVMGFADLLLMLKIPYNSNQALKLGEKIISFIEKEARQKSQEIGKRKGSFPNIKHSKFRTMRNATITTIAPTGTISIIANCSSGIEPLFALAFFREVLEGKKLAEINEIFKIELIKRNLWNEKIISEIMKTGSINQSKLPKDLKKVYQTALDIPPEQHVKMQSVFQKHVDNAVSKTVNLPEDAKVEDVKKVYLLAWKLKCKGITVYRYGSKEKQVLYRGAEGLVAKSQFSQSCPTGTCQL
jgi:ribonucleoside-diphosphate reductase alpha chain